MSKIKPHLPSSEPTHTIRISKAAPVSVLLARVSEKWGNITPARFWHTQINFLEQDPIGGIFYSSNRIERDSTQPFSPTEADKKKRLDESGLADGDAIIMETKHGEEWTIDLEATTLGERINRPRAQEPKVTVFTEEQMAKYRNHRASRPGVNSSYPYSQPGSGSASTTNTIPVAPPSYDRTLVLNGRSSIASSSRTVPPGTVGLNNLCGERRVAKQWVEAGYALEALGIEDDGGEPLMYDLFAVDEHIGGLGGGHYRAHAKNFEDNQSHHFDDTHTSLSDARLAVNANAYLLFYRRRTSRLLGGQTREKTTAAKERGLSGVHIQPVQPAATPSASKGITDCGPPDTFRGSGPSMSSGAANQKPFEDTIHDEIGGHSFNKAPPGFDEADHDEIGHCGQHADMESVVYPPRDGDVVFQTSDNVLFGVRRLLLGLASPIMNDMLAIGETCPDRNSVTIAEDSKTFQDLLSFIYPAKTPTVFSSLDPALQVLDAAAKYAMDGVMGSIRTQITSTMGVARDELLYQDPLRVYIKARRLDLNELADAAAKATLSININQVPDEPELADIPASWLWTLTKLRDAQSQWWAERCDDRIQVAGMQEDYTHSLSAHPYFRPVPCNCHLVTGTRSVPNRLQQKIVTYPCVRAVRKIDFAKELACLRCGAAAAAHIGKICDEHERIHGRW